MRLLQVRGKQWIGQDDENEVCISFKRGQKLMRLRGYDSRRSGIFEIEVKAA